MFGRARAGLVPFALTAGLGLAGCTALFGIDEGTLVGADASTDGAGGATTEGGGHDGPGTPDGPSGDGPSGSDAAGGGHDASVDHSVPPEAAADAPPSPDAPADTSSAADTSSPGDTGPDGPPPQGDAGVGKVGTLGDACSTPGTTACNGNDSQVVLICSGGVWAQSGASCPSTQRCDSTVGACADVATGCAGLQPGDELCSGGSALACGVDLTSTTTVAACGAHQTCGVSGGVASCTCDADPTCTVDGGVCTDASTLVTCATDGQGCLFASATTPCSGGVCAGSAGAAACCTDDPTCPSGAETFCSGADVVTCALGADGCYHATTSACGTDYTCVGGECSCSGNSCQGSDDGNLCVEYQSSGQYFCGCATSADCNNGGCCDTSQSRILCYPNGEGVGAQTCVNGVWQ